MEYGDRIHIVLSNPLSNLFLYVKAYVLVPSSLYNVACRTWPPEPCNSKNHAWRWIWLGSRIPSPKTCRVDLIFLVSTSIFLYRLQLLRKTPILKASFIWKVGKLDQTYMISTNLNIKLLYSLAIQILAAVNFAGDIVVFQSRVCNFLLNDWKKVIDILWVQSSKFYIWSKCLEQKVNFWTGM